MTDASAPAAHHDPFVGAVRTCFQNYVQFSGRAPRNEFWYFILFLIFGMIGAIVVNALIFGPVVTQLPGGMQSRYYGSGLIGNIFILATILPHVAVSCRRLHDVNLRGWWLLAPILLHFALLWGMTVHLIGLAGLWDLLRQEGAFSFVYTGNLVTIMMGLIFAGYVALIVALAKRGTKGPNRFGPDPLEGRA